jgi:FkbM family methyltransferase
MVDHGASRSNRLAALRSKLFDVVPDRALYTALAYQHRLAEPELKRLREIALGVDVAVDVGAWWGPWTYWLSRLASEVVSIEPNPHLAAFLERVRPHNGRILNVALSDRVGMGSLWLPPRGLGSEGVASLDHSSGADDIEISVHTIRLDDLELERVGFVKIDVEGHELRVLRGATETVRRCRPTLMVEIEERAPPGGQVVEAFDYLRDIGYEGRFVAAGTWHPVTEFDLWENQLRWRSEIRRHGYLRNSVGHGRRYVNNFVFTPVGVC